MRVTALFFILLCCSISYTTAQNDYLVATSPSQEISSSKEELFMFVPSQRDMFLPTLSVYDTEKGTDNSSLKHKILTFAGTEEKIQELSNSTSYTTRFIFECEGGKYYYEIKNVRLEEICEKNPRAYINGLVYLLPGSSHSRQHGSNRYCNRSRQSSISCENCISRLTRALLLSGSCSLTHQFGYGRK